MVITGGANRSFSTCGDFNEVTQLPYLPPKKTEEWIDRVIDLYPSCLGINNTDVMAVDQHCIGIGFQLAMCGDIIMASPEAQFTMPELRGGIACTIGSYMLDKVFGRARMLEFTMRAEQLPIDPAKSSGVVYDIVPGSDLMASATEAERCQSYPVEPFQITKLS